MVIMRLHSERALAVALFVIVPLTLGLARGQPEKPFPVAAFRCGLLRI